MPRPPFRVASSLCLLVSLLICSRSSFAQDQPPSIGVGLAISRDDDGTVWVEQVIPGSPADQAGAKEDDEILAIDGRAVADIKPDDLPHLLKGPEGSELTLTLRAEGAQPRKITMKRISLAIPPPSQEAPPAPLPPPNNPLGRPQPATPLPLPPAAGPASSNPLARPPAPQPAPTPAPTPAPAAAVPPPVLPPAGLPGQAPAGLSAPDWIKPGTRLTFYAGAASIQGVRSSLVQDPEGNWIDPQTGQRYSNVDNAGAGGQGFTQVNVAYLDRNTAALEIRSYGVDASSGAISTLAVSGSVGPAAAGADFWVHPQQLRQMQEQNTPELKILRMPYNLNGKTYNALRIQTTNAQGYSQHTYDLDSGVLLIAGSSTTGASVPTLGPGGQVQTGAGNTMLTQCRLLSIRDVSYPWANEPAPDWLANTRAFVYEGQQSTEIPGSPIIPFPCTVKLNIQQTGPGWAKYTQTSEVRYNTGVPSQPAQSERVVGTTQASPLWISPATLARLRPGQVVDEDPLTRVRYSVAGLNGNQATLVEAGPTESIETTYDARSGMLSAITLRQRVGIATITTAVTLRGKE